MGSIYTLPRSAVKQNASGDSWPLFDAQNLMTANMSSADLLRLLVAKDGHAFTVLKARLDAALSVAAVLNSSTRAAPVPSITDPLGQHHFEQADLDIPDFEQGSDVRLHLGRLRRVPPGSARSTDVALGGLSRLDETPYAAVAGLGRLEHVVSAALVTDVYGGHELANASEDAKLVTFAVGDVDVRICERGTEQAALTVYDAVVDRWQRLQLRIVEAKGVSRDLQRRMAQGLIEEIGSVFGMALMLETAASDPLLRPLLLASVRRLMDQPPPSPPHSNDATDVVIGPVVGSHTHLRAKL